jgi:hypothetical protein
MSEFCAYRSSELLFEKTFGGRRVEGWMRAVARRLTVATVATGGFKALGVGGSLWAAVALTIPIVVLPLAVIAWSVRDKSRSRSDQLVNIINALRGRDPK